MDPKYKNPLPANIQDLVDEIEVFAGLEIGVRLNPNPPSPTAPFPEHLAGEVNDRGATIFIRSDNDFSPGSVLHELLHIHRTWVEAVPQAVPRRQEDEDAWKRTGVIENALEHLVIVPRETKYGFESYDYWNETARRNWSRYPLPELEGKAARRCAFLLASLSARYLITDSKVKQLAEDCLRKEGLLHESKKFGDAIGRSITNKERAIAAVFRFLRLPRDDYILLKVDIKNRRSLGFPVPAF